MAVDFSVFMELAPSHRVRELEKLLAELQEDENAEQTDIEECERLLEMAKDEVVTAAKELERLEEKLEENKEAEEEKDDKKPQDKLEDILEEVEVSDAAKREQSDQAKQAYEGGLQGAYDRPEEAYKDIVGHAYDSASSVSDAYGATPERHDGSEAYHKHEHIKTSSEQLKEDFDPTKPYKI